MQNFQEAGGALLTNNLDSHLCPGQYVPRQLHLDEFSLANGVQEFVMANRGLLVSRKSHKVLQHDNLSIKYTDNTNNANNAYNYTHYANSINYTNNTNCNKNTT